MIKADPQNKIIIIDMTKMGIALQTQLHPFDTLATIINTIVTCLVIVDVLAPLYQRKTSGTAIVHHSARFLLSRNTTNNNSTSFSPQFYQFTMADVRQYLFVCMSTCLYICASYTCYHKRNKILFYLCVPFIW